jgi:hypothetical protein
MRIQHILAGGTLILAMVFGVVTAEAQFGVSNGNGNAWGVGHPNKTNELPPGQFRKSLEDLSPQARAKAMQTLRRFHFTEHDLEYMNVHPSGAIYFADVFLEDAELDLAANSLPQPDNIAPDQAFLLHSRPGSSNVLYLDFDGHTITGTIWNTDTGAPTAWYARSYDTEGDDTITTACSLPGTLPVVNVTFSNDERAEIGEIWHRTAEDFAPFDIDVTTEDPNAPGGPGFTSTTGHLLYTTDSDYCGQAMPSAGAGGVAYLGVFGYANYHTYWSPGLVYWDNLSSVQSRHEAGSHEFGHNLSLGHDGTSGSSYYTGHGDPADLVSWAPIMGAGYYRNVTQWSKSEYPGALLYNSGCSCYQSTNDDLAHIAGYLGYRPDDHGNDDSTTSGLLVDFDGTVAVSNPETDPHDLTPGNKGVIETRTDEDWFYFDTGAGAISLTVTPAWAAFTRSTTRGANLDIRARLINSSGAVLNTSDPTNDTNATVSATVASGRYYLAINGVGNPGNTDFSGYTNHGYTDYGSVGMYFVSGALQSGDEEAPEPDPMEWLVEPYALDANQISMTSVTATDAAPFIQYNFACVSGGVNCVDSGWQSSTTYVASGLAPLTQYTFTVQAKDLFDNTGTVSAQESATTLADFVAPTLDSASAEDSTHVLVNFNEPMEETSAETVANYAITGLTVSAAVLQPGALQVRLTTSAISNNVNYLLTVNNVTDISGNPVADDSQASFLLGSGATVSFQQGRLPTTGYSGSIDTTIREPFPNNNYGGSTTIWADGSQSGGEYIAMVEWDITDIPAGATILDATMNLTVSNTSNATYPCHEILRNWSESQSDWIEATGSIDWQTAGARGALDRGTDVLCQVAAPSSTTLTVQFTAAGIAAVQGWVANPSSNHGLLLSNNSVSDGAYFRSTEYSSTSQRPRLNVTYLYEGTVTTLSAGPTGLGATTVSNSRIELDWTDNSSNESGFRIERSPTGAGTWTQVGTVGANTTSYSDTGLSASTWYDYRVYAYNAGGASNYSNVASQHTGGACNSGTISPASNTWVMFALPCRPAVATPSAIVPLPDGDYGVTWVVYYHENDPPTGGARGYQLVGLNETMVEGGAFFFFATVAVPSFAITGNHNSGASVPLAAHASNGMFNLVGNPYNGVVEWEDTRVVDGASVLTLEQADPADGPGKLACDDTVNTGTCVMARKMYKWNGSNYDVSNGLIPTTGQFDPMDVVWVDGFKSGIELQFGAPAASSLPASASSAPSSRNASVASTGQSAHTACPEGRSTGATPSCPGTQGNNSGKTSKTLEDWYIQLIVESGEHADSTNYLGGLADATDGQDYRDLEEPAPFGGKYLSLVFLNDDFEPVNWGYTTDFRALDKHRRGTWNFVVRASAEFEEVTLRWEGEFDPFRSTWLKDLDTGKKIRMKGGESYTIQMNGGERNFELTTR